MGGVTADQFVQIFPRKSLLALQNATKKFEEIIDRPLLDVPQQLMNTIFNRLSVTMFGQDNIQSLSENGVRTLLNDILAPMIGYFSFSNGFERFSVKQEEAVRIPTNEVLRQAGIKSDGFADLVLTRGSGVQFARRFIVFEIKKDDINLALKQNFVYMHSLLSSQRDSKVSNFVPIISPLNSISNSNLNQYLL